MISVKMSAEKILNVYLQSLRNKYYRRKYAPLQQAISSIIEGKKVLDFGCVGGFFSMWMAKCGAEVWG